MALNTDRDTGLELAGAVRRGVDVLRIVRGVLSDQVAALELLAGSLGESTVAAVEALQTCRGRVIVSGIGKCGHVAGKIAATFSSTGTPAMFLHPSEAIHGDLGAVQPGDIALLLSNSGETAEMTSLGQSLRRLGLRLIGVTGKRESTLARSADIVLHVPVEQEGDGLGLAPMASTTAMLALGDALAVAMMRLRGFSQEDYARLHPGGSLGQKLLCRVHELMHTGDAIPITRENATMRDAILEMTEKRLGTTYVVDGEGKLAGILTDGDLRRAFQSRNEPLESRVAALMTPSPKHVAAGCLAVDALRMMKQYSITNVPVLDDTLRPVGALHIHDLLRAGLD